MSTDFQYMSRCIELAEKGQGNVAPNPLVGAVIVHNDMIIGEGYHEIFGKEHAEVNAIKDAQTRNPHIALSDCTLYVNLEPCSHFGKTPPCTELIKFHNFKKVVIGCEDPFEKVRGSGIKSLRENGIEVVRDVLKEEALNLNRRFITFITQKRPYIILKFAQSKDNFISAEFPTEENRWISNAYSRKLVHRWRSEEQAVMVGMNTALIDNPALTLRDWPGNQPLRIVLDRKLSLPNHLKLFDQSCSTLVFNELKDEELNNLQFVKINFDKDLPGNICDTLYSMSIQSVIIEGGQKLLQTFIDENKWDEARVFTAEKMIGAGTVAPEFRGRIVSSSSVDDDILQIYFPQI